MSLDAGFMTFDRVFTFQMSTNHAVYSLEQIRAVEHSNYRRCFKHLQRGNVNTEFLGPGGKEVVNLQWMHTDTQVNNNKVNPNSDQEFVISLTLSFSHLASAAFVASVISVTKNKPLQHARLSQHNKLQEWQWQLCFLLLCCLCAKQEFIGKGTLDVCIKRWPICGT